jgi:hypothetical protein
MRTLQEKYNAIQEGKFSKEHFLAEARMQQPHLVTRFNGYNDAVQILKNRGMIQEAYSTEEGFKDYSDDALADMIVNLSRYENNEREIEGLKQELARRKGVVKEARLTKNNLTDYRYKPTNEMDKYPYEQILRGIRVELEVAGVLGTPTAEEYAKALAKVSKNLAKDSIFYTNQLAGVNPKVDLHDKMVDATAKNTVDTFNGMKKIKDLKEDHTKKPDDKYTIKPCKDKEEPFAVWEGNKRVKGFATRKEAKEYADKQNKKQGLTESVLKEGIKNLIKKALMENNEDIFEMQGPKSDSYYKNELSDYLDDNGIFGYTKRIHDIMTGPDEAENVDELVRFLEDNQIYGYNRGIEAIYADYPYDQHWMNQPDEDEVDDIPHPRGYEEASDEETFDDLMEAADTEADRNMVRKLMTMYETEPSKFERLHKQTETQANTTQDIAFRRILSLMNRAKAGALQSLANQDRFEADREGMDEGFDEDKIEKYKQYTYTLDGETVIPDEIGFYNHYLGAELDGKFYKFSTPSEDGVVQLRSPQGKTGMYTENIFRSVSLKDLL